MSEREKKLLALGFDPLLSAAPAAIYRPMMVDGTTGYLSGAIPVDGARGLVYRGRVPQDLSVAEAAKAAALCAANLLRVICAELGSLDRIDRVLRLCGYVSSLPDFTEQHLVINGASRLLIDVLGEDAGKGARSAVGVVQLPLGAAVEVDLIVKIRP